MTKSTALAASLVSLALVSMISTTAVAGGPVSTAPGQNKLQCFDGPSEGTIYGGACTTTGVKGPATLDNTGGDPDGSYSGVYILNSTLNGKTIGAVGQLSFSYTGTPTAGSPRFSIPLDTNGDSATDLYAFVSAYYCNDGSGLVDAIRGTACTIFAGAETFPSWAAMVAAHPTWTITQDYAFLIADDIGIWTVSNVKLGKGGK